MKSIKHVLLLAFLFTLSACENDNNIPLNEMSEDGETNPFLQNFGDAIQARFIGKVVNEENTPISGVTINVGSAFATTDANGVFSIISATVYQQFANVKASKTGFINSSRSLVPTSGVNQVNIMLLDLEPVTTITAGQALTIDLPDGTEVDFPGQFTNQFGGPYLGEVAIIIKPLNVDNPNFLQMMPGNLTAENTDGDLRVLESYGMIAVELRGEGGEELNIAPGDPATIKIPVASSITNPPATIPLWYFDEDNGYWKEEGSAILVNGRYEGEVSHFSFWNCDAPFQTVDFCVTIVDQNSNPIPNILIQLDRDASGWTSTTTGYTDSNGLVCGLAPANETLTLTVPDFGCVNNDFSMALGPYSDNQNITVIVPNSNALTTNFTAIFNDCNGDAITNGYLQLFYNNEAQIIPITDGTISQVIDYCAADTSYSLQVIDVTNNQSTDVFNGNFTMPTTDLGTEMSCIDLSDTDNDGVIDINEDVNGNNNLDDDDIDGDGIPNYLDEDDDGDGVNTADEDYDNDGNPANDDTDGDQTPDYIDLDNDNDGLSDIEEATGVDNGQTNCNPNGNITDPNNADSDGDGFNDCQEGNVGTDPNDPNSFSSTGLIFEKEDTYTDSNNDGIVNVGDTITYVFTLTISDGQISDITIIDTLLGGDISSSVSIIGDNNGNGLLDINEIWVITALDYAITQQDINTGAVTNTATVDGFDEINGILMPIQEVSIDPTPIDSSSPFYNSACPGCTVTVF